MTVMNRFYQSHIPHLEPASSSRLVHCSHNTFQPTESSRINAYRALSHRARFRIIPASITLTRQTICFRILIPTERLEPNLAHLLRIVNKVRFLTMKETLGVEISAS